MRALRRAIVLLGLCLFAAHALRVFALRVLRQTSDALSHRHESPHESRERMLHDYARGIERIRRVIPQDAEYLVVEGRPGDGAHYFVVYDLAPRRALYLGGATGSILALRQFGPPERCPRWVVVSQGPYDAPLLVSAGEFFAGRP